MNKKELTVGQMSVLRQIDYRGPLPKDRIDDYTYNICKSLLDIGLLQDKNEMFCLTRKGIEQLHNKNHDRIAA